MTTASNGKPRAATFYIRSRVAELNRQNETPFFSARLDRAQAEELRSAFNDYSTSEDPRWFTLTATAEDPRRLRLAELIDTPRFEAEARGAYLRGEVFRVNGRGGESGSCNIDFSDLGAQLLAKRLATAIETSRRFVLLRVPHRRHNIVEFIADVELEALDSPEHEKLARLGEALVGETWADEDFSDWERPGD